MADLADYQWLTSNEAAGLLADFAAKHLPIHQQLSQLRKSLTAERAHLIVQQLELRQRAVAKFGEFANQMFFSDIGFQQATDIWMARYKAKRLADGVPVVDYCCGIGGDLLAFAERGDVVGWDRSSEIAHLASANLHVVESHATSSVCVGDVVDQMPEANAVWHLDPDRRSEGRRSTQLQWHSPGPEIVDRWLETCSQGILKLAPATVVPNEWSSQAELEWISRDRECRQQVVWFGSLAAARGQRRATTIRNPLHENESMKSYTFVGNSEVRADLTEEVDKYIYDTDPAIRAAGLTGAIAESHGLLAFDNGAAYLTGSQAVDEPLLTSFEVLDQLPLRVSVLSKYLRQRGVGRLEIKKRGVELEPERLRKQLKLRGDESATILLTRLGSREIAILARRDEG